MLNPFSNDNDSAAPGPAPAEDEHAAQDAGDDLTAQDLPPLGEIPTNITQHPAVKRVAKQERDARETLERLRQRRQELEAEARAARQKAGKLEVSAEMGDATREEARRAAREEQHVEAKIGEVERRIERREAALENFEQHREAAHAEAAREISQQLAPHIRARYQRIAELVAEASALYTELHPVLETINKRSRTARGQRIDFPHRPVFMNALLPAARAGSFLRDLRSHGYEIEVPE